MYAISNKIYCFEGYTLDLRRGCLRCARNEIELRPKSFNLLRHLVENAGRLVSRDELIEAVWPSVVVTDDSLARCMSDVRLALGDSEQRMIKTVPRRGYVCEASVTEPAAVTESTPQPVTIAEQKRGLEQAGLEQRPAERRQLTVMACEFVGLAVLSARLDPEDLRAVTAACQRYCTEIIGLYQGCVAHCHGDGILAYFGYPDAHEHDAENAVRAGLTLIGSSVPLGIGLGVDVLFRVGMASGVVIIGDELAAGGAIQRAAIGETPNVAARLQAIASAGTLIIADGTRRLVGGLFEYRDLGRLMLEGLAEPARAWQVLGPSCIDSRFEALRTATTPLIGRDEELELLLRRWRQSAHGEGRVVLLSGEPGIGKSRLAVELQEQLQAELHTHLGHFCSPHHQDSALFPIISRLEREAGFQRGDTDQQRLDKLEAVLGRATNDLGDAVPPIADLLSVSSGNRYPALDLTPQKRKEKTLRALLAQLEGLAAHHPVLTVFEDVHWIDPTSLELLDLIVDRVPTLPVLVIITCRPEFAPTWIGRPHVTLLTLNRLPPSERAKMIAEVAGGKALPREIADQIIDRTDGVPLFIEELTKTVVESGILVAAGDRYAVTGPGTPLSIPSTLQGSLLARLDRLPATREVAQIGAALGRSFFHELVSAVAEMPQQKLDDALAQLVRAELMFRRGTPPDAEYTFKHALVQDAAYSTFPRSRRQQIHARIATTLETRFPEIVAAQPQLMAQHCTEAGLNEKAVNYRLKAGQQAIARSAMAEAEALLRPGLALIASLPDNDWREEQELDLLITLGRALIATHGWGAPEIGEAYARARELCDRLNRPRKLLPILYGRFVHHALRADLDKAQQLAAEMRRLGETQNDVVARVMAYRVSGYASLAFGDFVTARDYLERSLGLYNPTDRAIFAELTPQDIVPTLLSFLACALVCSGHLDQARSRRDAALTEARRLSHAYTSAYAGWWDWYVGWIARSEPGALLQSAEKLLALSVHGGLAFWRAMAIANRGWCLAALGQPEQGIPLVASGLREYHATGNTQFTPLLLTTLADAHRIAGNPQAGLKQLAEAERLAEATRERIVLSETLRLRGDLLLLTDDRGGAEVSFTDAIAVARRQAARLFELRATTSLARLWRDQDKCAEARDLLAPIYGWFTEGFDTLDLKEAKSLLDELPA